MIKVTSFWRLISSNFWFSGDVDVVESLADRNVDLCYQSKGNFTPLWIAIKNGQFQKFYHFFIFQSSKWDFFLFSQRSRKSSWCSSWKVPKDKLHRGWLVEATLFCYFFKWVMISSQSWMKPSNILVICRKSHKYCKKIDWIRCWCQFKRWKGKNSASLCSRIWPRWNYRNVVTTWSRFERSWWQWGDAAFFSDQKW